jgi:hypothetical protein
MTSQVCVDASLVLKLVLNEVDSTDAETFWRKWIANQVEIITPPLFPNNAATMYYPKIQWMGNIAR